MGKIKASILMLTYNQERYIDEAIRSVMLQQTSFPFELVIGNDASTDRTSEICRKWKEKYPDKIVLLDRKENLGIQKNYTQTYAACQGEYVALCDADDYWCHKKKLQRQVDFLDTHPDYAICFHRVVNYYEGDGTKSLSNGGQKTETDIIDLACGNYITNASVVFRNKVFGDVPEWFNQTVLCDYAFHMLTAQYGKIHYMRRPMTVYRKHGKSTWGINPGKSLPLALHIRELLMEYFKENRPVYDNLLTAYTKISFNLIDHYLSEGDRMGQADEVENRILYYHPGWTADDVYRMEILYPPTTSQRIKQRVRSVLSRGRALLSRLVPLPRIRG